MGNISLSSAVAYDRRIGVQYYIKSANRAIFGGTTTLGGTEQILRVKVNELTSEQRKIADLHIVPAR